MNFLEINGSSRQNSNSEFMAKKLLQGIPHEQIKLSQYIIHPIDDQRHSGKAWSIDDDDYLEVLEKMLEADTLIFTTPIYWYGISGLLKNFIDRWSQTLATMPKFRQQVRDKSIYLMIVGGDCPFIKGLPIIQQFQYICQFLNWKFVDYVIGNGNRPLDVENDQAAIEKINLLNKKLLEDNNVQNTMKG